MECMTEGAKLSASFLTLEHHAMDNDILFFHHKRHKKQLGHENSVHKEDVCGIAAGFAASNVQHKFLGFTMCTHFADSLAAESSIFTI